MIALPSPVKTMTAQSLTPEKREYLVEFLANRYLDNMSVRDLERFFLDVQLDYLSSYNDEELIGEIEDYSTSEEYQQLFGEE